MTNEEINKRIHELMGLCWYQNIDHNYNFTSDWSAFGMLWEWMQKHEKWEKFLIDNSKFLSPKDWVQIPFVPIHLINPFNFSTAFVEFFKQEEE